MFNRLLTLCLLVLCVTVTYIECGKLFSGGSRRTSSGGSRRTLSGGGGGSSSGGSGSSWGKGWGSSSGGSKITSILSESSVPHTYPSKPGILSGTNSGKSTIWLGSSGSSSHTYPSKPGILSGTNSGKSSIWWKSSGSQSNSIRPSHKYHTNTGVSYYVPLYVSTPQYVHVQNYMRSESRYRDLLTGLSLYNLGRTQNFKSHYYYDDNYLKRYELTGASSTYGKPIEEAKCILKIKENDKIQKLKIPCEIVSTFSNIDNETLVSTPETQVNKTACTTITNSTECTTNSIVLDPLAVQGPSLNTTNMECIVEIQSMEAVFKNNIDCNLLVGKLESNNDASSILPSKTKLKSWLSNPPWWMFIFVAM